MIARLHRHARARGERGFTLVEMMITVAIVVVLVAVVFSLSLTNFGGNAQNVSDSITGQLALARLRAVSKKQAHAIQLTSSSVSIWQCTTTGMVAPVTPYATSCPNQVNELDLPSNVKIWNTESGAFGPGNPSAPTSINTSLDQYIIIQADGSVLGNTSTTIYVADNQLKAKYRVLLYAITGASNDRVFW